MFLRKEYEYNIIDDSISVDYLQKWCKENGIDINIGDNSSAWCAFTQYYCISHKLDMISAASMGYIVSSLFAGNGMSASTEIYIREEEITFNVVEKLNELHTEYDDEDIVAVNLFDYIFDLYQNNISDYEYKDEKLIFRVGTASLLRFMEIEGESKSDKFRNLLQKIYK